MADSSSATVRVEDARTPQPSRARPAWNGLTAQVAVAVARCVCQVVIGAGIVVLPLAALGVFYAWLATQGLWQLPPDANLYHDLADAFLAGQVHLQITPHPELVAAPNPYDPVVNAPYRVHELAYYKGKYYLYFAPLPGVIHALWLAVSGSRLHTLFVQLIAAYLAILGFYATLRATIQPYPTRIQIVLASMLTLSFGLSAPMLYLIGWSTVYHEPYLIAAAGLTWMCWALLHGLTRTRFASAYWLLAGICLSIALAARATSIAYLVVIGIAGTWFLYRQGWGEPWVTVRVWCGLFLPVGVTMVAIGVYNFVRFESPLEVGQIYVLTGDPNWYRTVIEPRSLLSLSVVPTSALVYLFAIPGVAWDYPFFRWSGSALSSQIPGTQWPPIPASVVPYVETPSMSVFLMAPVTLGCLLLPTALRRARHRERSADLTVLLVAMAMGSVAAFILIACFRAITVRYFMDFLPVLALLGGMAVLLAAAPLASHVTPSARCLAFTGHWRAVLMSGGIVLLMSGIAIGFVVGAGTAQYAMPSRAFDIRAMLDDTIANLRARLVPNQVPSTLFTLGRTAWSMPDGRYFNGSKMRIRAIEQVDRMVLSLSVLDRSPAALIIAVDGKLVAGRLVDHDHPEFVVDLERPRGPGEIVEIELKDASEKHARGQPLPVVVDYLALRAGDSNDPNFARQAEVTAGELTAGADYVWAPDVLIGGVSGDWITSAGLDVVLGPDLAGAGKRLQIAGRWSLHWLGVVPDVSAERIRLDGTTEAVLATLSTTENEYLLELEIARPQDEAEQLWRAHVSFSTYFVPGPADPRELVVWRPSRWAVLP